MSVFPKATTTPEVNVITAALYSQIMSVMGLKRTNLVSRCLYPIFLFPATRLSKLLVELDRNIAQKGASIAVGHFLSYFVDKLEVTGAANIPKHGPLMVICNHPAAYDTFILVSAIQREDIKVIASDVQILQLLPHVADHIIPVPYHIPSRLQTVRETIHHLKMGGAIFIFPRGNVEPDPAVSPGAEESLSGWSPSIELFLRSVPETQTVVSIASGVLSAKWYKNPLINIWKKYEQRQKVAEIFQVASQLFTGRVPATTPRVSFSAPLTTDDLGGLSAPNGAWFASLIERSRHMLAEHPHV